MTETQLVIKNLSKTFNRELLFEHLDLNVDHLSSLAVTGQNGSGKSTLLKIIAGLQLPSEGSVSLLYNKQLLAPEQHYQYLAFVAPYIELIEEYSLEEMLHFYFRLKPLVSGINIEQLPELFLLNRARHKPIRSFSSGMKQRLKLGLAFYTDVPLILLDEPTSHLDEEGKKWYQKHLQKLSGKRTFIIASNQEDEIEYCTSRILLGGQ